MRLRPLYRTFLSLAAFLGLCFFSDTIAAETSDLIVVRHGEAMHNVAKCYNSNPDHSAYTPSYLTEAGKQQVRATAKRLLDLGYNDCNVTAVYVSPLPRTLQTAEILAESGLFSKDKIAIDPRLIETQVGELEGQPLVQNWQESFAEKYQTETDEQLRARVKDFHQEIIIRPSAGNIVVVTHQAPGVVLLGINSEESFRLSTGEACVQIR